MTCRMLINNEIIDKYNSVKIYKGHVAIGLSGKHKDFEDITKLLNKCRWIIKLEIIINEIIKTIHVKIWKIRRDVPNEMIILLGHTEYLGEWSNC